MFDYDEEGKNILEPSEWIDEEGIIWRIIKLPYGYVLEKSYVTGIWHKYYDYKYGYRGHIIDCIDHWNTYQEAKKYLFSIRKNLTYEHL